MNSINSFDLENLWEQLLSRNPQQVRAAYDSLSTDQQAVVAAHLRRMATEPGWHIEQQRSAAAALEAIEHSTP